MGVWPLVDLGCGITDVLVVTGPARGTVWTWGDGLLTPHRGDDGTPLTFTAWFEKWLDDGLAAVHPEGLDAPRSAYVLELHGEVHDVLHAATEPADLRRALEDFCADSHRYAFLPPPPERPLGIWVVEANTVTSFLDARPHLVLVKGDQRACFDAPHDLKALTKGVTGMPQPGDFHVEALWDAIEQQLPKLEGVPLADGESVRLLSARSTETALPPFIALGRAPWDAPPPKRPADAPAEPAQPQATGWTARVARFLGLH